MNEQRYTYRVQWAAGIAGAFLFLLLFTAWIRENSRNRWRDYQKEYAGILAGISGNGMPEVAESGILQVSLPALDRVDRCMTCHLGLEDSRMSGMPQPHTSHPGEFLTHHPVERYGCTICHGGQGRALTKEAAFGQGRETHWTHPVLDPPFIQSACGKCHLSVFASLQGEGTPTLAGMEVLARGQELFSSEGCLGCHKARGVGGILGPDLTRQGEKTKHEYSFRNVRGEQTVSNWLKEHFRDPEMVSPGSQMLQIDLEEADLDALATCVMGLSKPEIPFDYFSLSTLEEFKGRRPDLEGRRGFAYLCSACHGKEGEGKPYEDFDVGIPAIGSTDFLRIASREYIRFTLEKGRSLRQMGSWTKTVSGLHDRELDAVTAYLKEGSRRSMEIQHPAPGGDPASGEALFQSNCAPCHGEQGRGGVAVALAQEGFLSRADDPFILETLLRGRQNTAMPGWAHLTDRQLFDLITHIRGWGSFRPAIVNLGLPEPDQKDGERQFHYLCSRCHGEFGEGETGPALINDDFLEVAGNRYLYETIALGRAHSAMFGWTSDVYNQEVLTKAEIANIIGYMRARARAPLTYIFPGPNPGNRDAGREIFADRCAECHGPEGEGILAPALNNQELLSAASNGYLLAMVTLGRGGTAMPAWAHPLGERPALSGAERQDVVAHVRSWQRIRIKF